jgi:hypothetical protein
MIWTLRIECVWGMYLEEDCVRVLEIESTASLLSLHAAIQDAVKFDFDHLFEFYAGRNYRDRNVVFADEIGGAEMFGAYADITLEGVYPLEKGLKLYYCFDFGDEWRFEIKKSRKKPHEPEPGATYPRVVERIGPDPPQYGSDDEEI